jgi:hypothetical protein
MKSLLVLFATVAFATVAFAQKDCVMMKDGKMWVVKNMTTTMTCKNGSTVMANGTVKDKAGKTTMMKNGDCVCTDGSMMKMNAGSKSMDCMMMKDGKMMTVMAMDKTMTMKNGNMVMADGTVKGKDGKMMKMANGDWIDMDGNMTKAGASKM